MSILERLGIRTEARNVQDPTKTVSAGDFFQWLTGGIGIASSDVLVNEDTAMTVPAVWAAVNFLSGTLAGLPLKVYRKTKDGREEASGVLPTILHDAINDGCSSFEWRKHFFDCVLTTGRGLSYIERGPNGRSVIGIWQMDPSKVRIERNGMRKVYIYSDGGQDKTYQAQDIIDVPFMLKKDGLSHRSPINSGKEAIGQAIAAMNYGSKFFQNGGIPPFVITGNFQSEASLVRAGEDLRKAVRKASKESRSALTLPEGLELKPIGVDPEKTQLLEMQRFAVEQIARIYSMPPTFLQDLTHGTFSNTEQQDLHFVKHTLKRWAEQFEQELNLKIFGARSRSQYVELNMDGLLRGDFKARMEGYATAVTHGILKPNEARRRENLPDDPAANQLFIQGATVPISQSGVE